MADTLLQSGKLVPFALHCPGARDQQSRDRYGGGHRAHTTRRASGSARFAAASAALGAIGNAVVFLARPMSGGTSGTIPTSDGGRWAAGFRRAGPLIQMALARSESALLETACPFTTG